METRTTITRRKTSSALRFRRSTIVARNHEQRRSTVGRRGRRRRVVAEPCCSVEVEGLVDNYFFNVIDWSADGVVVGLMNTVFDWNWSTNTATQLCQHEAFLNVCSVRSRAETLVVGDAGGTVYFADLGQDRVRGQQTNHEAEVNCIDWVSGLTVTGGRDGRVCFVDDRAGGRRVHEVRLATGVSGVRAHGPAVAVGESERVSVFDVRVLPRRICDEAKHLSAVKALAWCPWRDNVVASGGGVYDRSLRVWNVRTREERVVASAQAQVVGLTWDVEGFVVASLGYPLNGFLFFDAATLRYDRLVDGHAGRILSSISRAGTVCTIGADNIINLWRF